MNCTAGHLLPTPTPAFCPTCGVAVVAPPPTTLTVTIPVTVPPANLTFGGLTPPPTTGTTATAATTTPTGFCPDWIVRGLILLLLLAVAYGLIKTENHATKQDVAEVGLTTNAILAISVEASGASVDENGTYIVPRLAGKADLAGLAKKSDLSGLATSSALTALGNEVDGNEAARKADAKAFRSAVYRASKRHATALAALPPPATTDLSGLATKQDVAEIRAAIDDARAQVVVTPAALPLPALPEAP